MEANTGHVLITAEQRPPGHTPKCAVCREVIPTGEPCIRVRGQLNQGSQFFMHAGCSAGVLFNLMLAFNHTQNGLSKGNGHEPLELGRAMQLRAENIGITCKAEGIPVQLVAKRGPGRPLGSKNKVKKPPKKRPVGRPPKKRGRGRPKGSKNKPKR